MAETTNLAIIERLEKVVHSLQDNSVKMGQLLAVHNEKLNKQDRIDGVLFEKIESVHREINRKAEEIKNSHSIIWHARSGFLIVFLNPKVAAFFLAIFTQFLGHSPSFETKSIMVLTATAIDAGWYVLVSFIIALPIFMNFLASNSQRLELILGCILVLVCILLGFKISANLLV